MIDKHTIIKQGFDDKLKILWFPSHPSNDPKNPTPSDAAQCVARCRGKIKNMG
jgi:hypothetical protein